MINISLFVLIISLAVVCVIVTLTKIVSCQQPKFKIKVHTGQELTSDLTLLQIVKRDFTEWPCHAGGKCSRIIQDQYGCIYSCEWGDRVYLRSAELAKDYKTAVVTRNKYEGDK